MVFAHDLAAAYLGVRRRSQAGGPVVGVIEHHLDAVHGGHGGQRWPARGAVFFGPGIGNGGDVVAALVGVSGSRRGRGLHAEARRGAVAGDTARGVDGLRPEARVPVADAVTAEQTRQTGRD